MKETSMKRQILLSSTVALAALLILSSATFAQGDQVRASLKASVMQTLGVDTEITIVYSRPGVKGRTIWGELVPYGLAPGNRYSKDQPYPWRAGANESTTIEFSKDVVVEGKPLPAGKYSIHMIPSENEWTVIFNKNNAGWGSYAYNKAEDALQYYRKTQRCVFSGMAALWIQRSGRKFRCSFSSLGKADGSLQDRASSVIFSDPA